MITIKSNAIMKLFHFEKSNEIIHWKLSNCFGLPQQRPPYLKYSFCNRMSISTMHEKIFHLSQT